MRVLFDQGTPVPLRDSLASHAVDTAFEQGWSHLQNGELLDSAERDGYEVFVTTDQNLRYQQNLSSRRIAIIVLTSTSWRLIQGRLDQINAALDEALPGSYVEVPI